MWGPQGVLQKPEKVAVKVMYPSGSEYGAELLALRAEEEAQTLQTLQEVQSMKKYTVPLHLLHLPPLTEPAAPVYIVMG